MLDDQHKQTIRLILRSEDEGDGWRQCTSPIFGLFTPLSSELFELDHDKLRVRLTSEGKIVGKWLV